jgi:mono/diheme cytochrome c family protein
MKFVITTLIISILTECVYATGYTISTSSYNNYQYQTTISQVIILGVPVVDLNRKFYYSVGAALQRRPVVNTVPSSPAQPELTFKLIGETTTTVSSTNLDSDVAQIFRDSCIKCHKNGQDKYGVKLLGSDGVLHLAASSISEKERRKQILEAIQSGAMPKNGAPLPKEKIDKIKQWYESKKG